MKLSRRLIILVFVAYFFKDLTSGIASMMRTWGLFPGSGVSTWRGICLIINVMRLDLSTVSNIDPSGEKLDLGMTDIS